MKLLIITGMSGAGKSQTANAIEDMGFYCVDNIPPQIIPSFVSLSEIGNEELNRIAVVTDARGGDMFASLPKVLENLEQRKVDFKILFLDASDEILIKRYRENRRKHPLCDNDNVSLEEAVKNERKMLLAIREKADYVIDTSTISVAKLKQTVSEMLFGNVNEGFSVLVKSFGFKYGPDSEADIMLDARCLPNPFYVESLKDKTGLTSEINEYIFSFKESNEFKVRLLNFIDYSVPLYAKEGKSRLVISVGCTGGKHRSVAFAEIIYKSLKIKGYNVSVFHRDIEK